MDIGFWTVGDFEFLAFWNLGFGFFI